MNLDPALTRELPSFVTHLECSMTGQSYEADQVHGLSNAGKPLLVRYDLPALAVAMAKEPGLKCLPMPMNGNAGSPMAG